MEAVAAACARGQQRKGHRSSSSGRQHACCAALPFVFTVGIASTLQLNDWLRRLQRSLPHLFDEGKRGLLRYSLLSCFLSIARPSILLLLQQQTTSERSLDASLHPCSSSSTCFLIIFPSLLFSAYSSSSSSFHHISFTFTHPSPSLRLPTCLRCLSPKKEGKTNEQSPVDAPIEPASACNRRH